MTSKCFYNDCGWCYAPSHLNTNAVNGACKNPKECPTLNFETEELEMTTRPKYIRCIQHKHSDYKNKTWCGKTYFICDWVFQDIDHAVYAILDESRQVPCPECISTIREVIK